MSDNEQTYKCRKCGRLCGLRICAQCLMQELQEVREELDKRGRK